MGLRPSASTKADDRPTASAPQPSSLRANIGWTFLGNAFYAFCQWLMVVVLARLGGRGVVGEFALAFAVTSPVIMLANMQLRWVQATYADEGTNIRDCLGFRIVGMGVALAICVGIACLRLDSAERTSVFLWLALAKAIEGLCDVLYGWYQQRERMEYISYSLLVRGPLSVAAVAVGFQFGDLRGACVALAVTWAVILFAFDIPQAVRFHWANGGRVLWPRWRLATQRNLLLRALPLGLTAAVAALQANVPRYLVEESLGAESLGVFAGMAYLVLAGETFVRAVNQSALPRMARYLRGDEWSGFRGVVWKLSLLGCASGAAALALSLALGNIAVSAAYGSEFVAPPGVLVTMVLATAISFALRPAEVGLRSMRRFWSILAIHSVGFLPFVALGYWGTEVAGLTGVAWAMVAQAAWHGLAMWWWFLVAADSRPGDTSADGNPVYGPRPVGPMGNRLPADVRVA